ncbi:hypothetical protein Cgig2_021685 [Carnegiea gigantea]|uniref:Uncharacterized protein n=1 Tax=Carnegiea gigantea TaxID=171969 RepID=A0A9Q1QPQ9_9CARY|nr:hypothetical protein Cgig2_021685 [Carnegiea gigantea]
MTTTYVVNLNQSLDSKPVSVPKDFNDDKEVLIIGEQGNARKFRRRIIMNVPNTIHGVSKSSGSQMSKKHVSMTNEMGNSMTFGSGHVTQNTNKPRLPNLLNQVDEQNIRVGKKTDVIGSLNSKELNIAESLNFDQTEQNDLAHMMVEESWKNIARSTLGDS